MVKSIYPTNLLKVVVFLPKSNARFQLKKDCKQLALCQEIILSSETANQWDSGTSLRQRQRVKISQEKSPIAETFFFQYLDCSVEHWGGPHNNEQSCQRQRQYVQQKWKNCKMCWGARQWIDRQLSIYDLWQFVMFCIKVGTCINKRNPIFNIIDGKFLVWRRLLCWKSGC